MYILSLKHSGSSPVRLCSILLVNNFTSYILSVPCLVCLRNDQNTCYIFHTILSMRFTSVYVPSVRSWCWKKYRNESFQEKSDYYVILCTFFMNCLHTDGWQLIKIPKSENNRNPYHRSSYEFSTKYRRCLVKHIFKHKRASFWSLKIQYYIYHSSWSRC